MGQCFCFTKNCFPVKSKTIRKDAPRYILCSIIDAMIQMILDGQCGQFNPILLKCLKELSIQFSKMLDKEMNENSYYHEVQRLSNEILSDRSLPNQNYSQSVVKVMQEKIDFFKSNSGKNSIDYNAISGQVTIQNGKQQILCQRYADHYSDCQCL